ncbi:hypothetical protein IWX49DRAFT_29640 [Phyllosticta citricarpa]
MRQCRTYLLDPQRTQAQSLMAQTPILTTSATYATSPTLRRLNSCRRRTPLSRWSAIPTTTFRANLANTPPKSIPPLPPFAPPFSASSRSTSRKRSAWQSLVRQTGHESLVMPSSSAVLTQSMRHAAHMAWPWPQALKVGLAPFSPSRQMAHSSVVVLLLLRGSLPSATSAVNSRRVGRNLTLLFWSVVDDDAIGLLGWWYLSYAHRDYRRVLASQSHKGPWGFNAEGQHGTMALSLTLFESLVSVAGSGGRRVVWMKDNGCHSSVPSAETIYN